MCILSMVKHLMHMRLRNDAAYQEGGVHLKNNVSSKVCLITRMFSIHIKLWKSLVTDLWRQHHLLGLRVMKIINLDGDTGNGNMCFCYFQQSGSFSQHVVTCNQKQYAT